jgi:hypothetical protein
MHEDCMEDASIDRPIISPDRTRTGISGALGNLIASPNSRSTSIKGLKRTHDDISGSNNVWSETRLREGHGIRLLRLHGGYLNAPLEGRLILSDGRETYEAMSYGGEPEQGSSSISIFSAGSTYKLAIKPNLEAALRQLRFPDRYRLLWIDAICINQEDIPEQDFHIQRMGSIFNTAVNVCIWLGTADTKSVSAFKLIRKFEQNPDLNIDSEEEHNKSSLDNLIGLLRRRWFTRRWAIQELALAKKATLHCGHDSISWIEFTNAITLLLSNLLGLQLQNAPEVGAQASDRIKSLASTAGCHFVELSSNIFRKSDEGTILDSLQSLESLMCNLSAFETTTVHDNIYALLSLAEDTGARHSVRPAAAFSMGVDDPDPVLTKLNATELRVARNVVNKWRGISDSEYRVDNRKSAVEVCRDFVKFVVYETRSLDIICRPWAPAAYRKELPSWIATLSKPAFENGLYAPVQADALVGTVGINKKPYNASRRYPASWRFGAGTQNKSLFVDGCILDSIKYRRATAYHGDIPSEWEMLGDWAQGKDPLPERFWRTLVANRGQNASNPPLYFEKACQYVLAQEKSIYGEYLTGVLDHHPRYVAEFLHRVRSIIWMRRMIWTEQEHLLGLAPDEAQEGDLICIIFGCSVPVVLRKVVGDEMTGERHYRLLGDCYVHGMMDGEAFTMQHARNIPQTQFELR